MCIRDRSPSDRSQEAGRETFPDLAETPKLTRPGQQADVTYGTREWNLGRKSRLVVDCAVAYKDRPRAGRFKALQRCIKRRRRRLKPEAAITAYDCTEHGQKLHRLKDCPCNPLRLIGADSKAQFAFGQGLDQIDRAREE